MGEDEVVTVFTAYVALPLTSLEGDSRNYALFLGTLIEKICQEKGYLAYLPFKHFDPVKHSNIHPFKVHLGDRTALANCDLVIMYVGKPSHGVGIEYEVSFEGVKPVILLVEKEQGVSRMILGGFAPIITLIEFAGPEDLEKQLSTTLQEIKSKLHKIRSLQSEDRLYCGAVGKRIEEARRLKGMKREELAAQVGLPVQFFEILERDAYVAAPFLSIPHRIAQVLKVPVYYLFDPSISREVLLNLESMRELSEFARESNLSYIEYEELLNSAALKLRAPEQVIRKSGWRDLYYSMKRNQNNKGEENGQKKLEEFFG
jgi:transcriptional regulator with XRE-family HTH domain